MNYKIPTHLYDTISNEPFAHCIICERYLLDGKVQYFIEKAIKQYKSTGYDAKDTIFEYAMCMDCAENTKDKLSKESKQTIEEYFSQITPNMEHEELTCMVKGDPITNYSEYQLMTLCQGTKMLIEKPFAIGYKALEELTDIISNETKDELNGMMGDFFGSPPGLEEVLPTHRIPILI